MSDLAEFLNARLDDEQRNAEEAAAQWPASHFTVEPGSLVIVKFHRDHDPGRVLREVDAKRKILGLHQPQAMDRWQVCAHCRPVDPEIPDDLTSEPWPCRTLRALAAVYSDHPPDYDRAWA